MNKNMRKMYSEQEITDLIKKAISGGEIEIPSFTVVDLGTITSLAEEPQVIDCELDLSEIILLRFFDDDSDAKVNYLISLTAMEGVENELHGYIPMDKISNILYGYKLTYNISTHKLTIELEL